MTAPTPRSVFVVGDGEGDCLFASGVEQYAKDHFQLCVDEANDFRTGPYTLTEYVPKRDLAARDVELKAIAHHVGGGAFYRDEHGGRLPMRDQVGQHIAELNQQLAARDAELAEWKRKAEENARDAGRYRWLRGNPCLPFGVTRYRSEPVEYYAGDSLDASIDAAIAAKWEATRDELLRMAVAAKENDKRTEAEIIEDGLAFVMDTRVGGP